LSRSSKERILGGLDILTELGADGGVRFWQKVPCRKQKIFPKRRRKIRRRSDRGRMGAGKGCPGHGKVCGGNATRRRSMKEEMRNLQLRREKVLFERPIRERGSL